MLHVLIIIPFALIMLRGIWIIYKGETRVRSETIYGLSARVMGLVYIFSALTGLSFWYGGDDLSVLSTLGGITVVLIVLSIGIQIYNKMQEDDEVSEN